MTFCKLMVSKSYLFRIQQKLPGFHKSGADGARIKFSVAKRDGYYIRDIFGTYLSFMCFCGVVW